MGESTYAGGCLCGAVRFAIDGPIERCVHCHCSMCRRNHGAGFVTWLVVPRTQLRFESGQEQLTRYASSAGGSRSFCGKCGSSMFCDLEAHPDVIDVVLGCVDDSGDLAPQLHVFWNDRVAWLHHGDDLPRLGGKTGIEPV